MTAVHAAPEGGAGCPQCGGQLADGQDWCLRCGRGATTRVLAARHWRIPIALLAIALALAGAGVGLLFVALSGDDQRVVTSGELTTTVIVTSPSPAAGTPTVTQTTPGAPGAATPAPGTPALPPTTTAAPSTTAPPATPTTDSGGD